MTTQERLDDMVARFKADGYEVLCSGTTHGGEWFEITYQTKRRNKTTVDITYMGNEWITHDNNRIHREEYRLHYSQDNADVYEGILNEYE